MNKNIIRSIIMGLLILPFALALPVEAAAPNWDATGAYQWLVLGTYAHDMTITQVPGGAFSGTGGYPAGNTPYTAAGETPETITAGQVDGNTITFTTTFTGPYNPGYSATVTGVIAPDGTMSGTVPWEWHTTNGNAVLVGTLSPEDFGVVDYNTGLGQIRGYTAGFGLTDATFTGVQSVVVKLYAAGDVLLQTNTATSKVGTTITGVQISSPFDVSGNFDYVTDGYWTNVKQPEYGQSVPAVKVVATVTLANGKIVTATNITPTGEAASIFPPTSVQIHLFKYLDGVQATGITANNINFPMLTTFNDSSIGSGTNVPFTLNPSGWTTGDIAYEASTGPRVPGSSASFSEDTSTNLVGTSCDGTHNYALVGYSTGATLNEAIAATQSTTAPNFTPLIGDRYVVVWNKTCQVQTPTTLKVHIQKYLDGALATGTTANNYQFPMTATWTTANLNGGVEASGTYVLGNNYGGAPDLYGADTAAMQTPADYTTSEITNNTQVVADPSQCTPGKYLLKGYRTSTVSFADAAAQALSTTVPLFTGLAIDQYIIVDNSTCPTKGSLVIEKHAIGGDGIFKFTGDMGSFQIKTMSGMGSSQTFNNITPGTYSIIETAQNGWTMTSNDCSSIVVNAGGITTCIITNTKNPKLGEIRGTKFEDWNGDGKTFESRWETKLSGWTIYLDTNDNGVLDSGEPSTVTDSHGSYRFSNLPAGTYHVREVQQSGWMSTYPSSTALKDKYDIALAAGQIAKNKNFGNFKLGNISGMKFNDANGNRNKDKNEVGLQGWTINLTKVGSSTIIATTVTDANGNYSFANVEPGTYQVREVQQSGWVQTTNNPQNIKVRSGTNSTKNNFGNHLGPVDNHRGFGFGNHNGPIGWGR